MTAVVTLPRAQIPLTLNGSPISAEWYRWAHDLTMRTGGTTAASMADVLSMLDAIRLQPRPAPPVVRAATGVLVDRTADGWQVGLDFVAVQSLLPRERPQRDVADSQAVLAGQVFGY